MTEEIKKQVHESYDNDMEKPNNILRIFQDFFGEDRVDMQGFLSKDEFCEIVSTKPLGTIIDWADIIRSSAYNRMTSEDKLLIKSLWDEEEAYEEIVTSDTILVKYFLPIIVQTILYRMGNTFILVYFPVVRVTNEFDKYIDIKDLWVKVPFDSSGRGRGYFGMNRSSYSIGQFKSNYLHSHCMGIPKEDFEEFQTPCTGRGPINSTLITLSIGYDEAMWKLLCFEIDQFVGVESISGVPYYRLESVLSSDLSNNYVSRFSMWGTRYLGVPDALLGVEGLKEFVRYLLSTNKLKFSYTNGGYGIGMSFISTVILISNEFINYINKEKGVGTYTSYETLISRGVIQECSIVNSKIYFPRQTTTDRAEFERYIGKRVCIFKGKEVTLTIEDLETPPEESLNKVVILNLLYIEAIIYKILQVLNYGYGKKKRIDSNCGNSPQTRYI